MNTKHTVSSRAITVIIVTMLPFLIRAQETTTLTGTVYSTKANSPIPGVRILSSETGRTAISDEKGNFAFTGLRYSDTLSFRSVGYLPVEMPVRNMENSHLDVFLDESMSFIDEVIVNTGYQSLAKERTTGSFTLIDNQLFNRSVSTALISRLVGVTSGLLFNLPLTQEAPSTTPDLRVRGVSTIFGESNPLIVIDNFPYEGDI